MWMHVDMTLSFHVPGPPVPWSRAGRNGDRYYTPDHVKAYQTEVALRANAAGAEPSLGAFSVFLRATLPIPASWTKGLKQAARDGKVHATSRPDSDNYAKAVLDACNKVIWADDSQVVELHIVKIYGDDPGLFVAVEKLPDERGRVAA